MAATHTVRYAIVILFITLLFGSGLGASLMYFIKPRAEGFQSHASRCGRCGLETEGPDLSKYVLKSSIPPCPSCPDMSLYMLKTECPPVPDLSKYVLKSSVPKPQPIIIDSSACGKSACGECPPCPRPRCPDVKCPAPTKCPQPAPCPRPICPQQQIKCKAEEIPSSNVRPFLAPLGLSGYGMA